MQFLKGAFYTLKHSVPKEDVDPIYYRRVLITKCTMAKLQKKYNVQRSNFTQKCQSFDN